MTMTFIQSQLYENQNFDVHFLTNLDIHLDEIQSVATTCWFAEAYVQLTLHK